MIQALDTPDFLQQSAGHLTIDVRSEGEYNYGHIPHAINLPLFNNEERKTVGTIYKQQGNQPAILEGLEITGRKMAGFVRTVQPLVTNNKIFVHCWRGGMRSGSMAWLFNLFGYQVYTLKGGYKNYRRTVLDAIRQKKQYQVLSGKTGSGKTALLQVLKQQGEQVIDLEALACHKGSAFGMLGQPLQPSTEHFENMLYSQLQLLDITRPIWIEDESKKIGTVVLNDELYKNMRSSNTYVLQLPLEQRLKTLTAEYAGHPIDSLQQSVNNIKKRLGGLQWKNAIEALHAQNFEEVARIVLHYYDKTYTHSLSLKETMAIYHLNFNGESAGAMAAALIQAKNNALTGT